VTRPITRRSIHRFFCKGRILQSRRELWWPRGERSPRDHRLYAICDRWWRLIFVSRC